MRLSQHLRNPHSPLTRFIKSSAAVVTNAKRGAPFGAECQRVLGFDLLTRAVSVPPVKGATPWVVGAAFDHRLRYQFAPHPITAYCFGGQMPDGTRIKFPGAVSPAELRRWKGPIGVEWRLQRGPDPATAAGALGLVERLPSSRAVVERFLDDLDTFTRRIDPSRGELSDGDETLLARHCVVLALLESVYRRQAYVREQELVTFDARNCANLLDLAKGPEVVDVVHLAHSSELVLADVFAAVHSHQVVYRPGSDFIVGDCLFELKTTRTLDGGAVRDALIQLVGHCLFDPDDDVSTVRRVGV